MFHVLMNKQKQMSSCNPLRLFCYHLLLPLQVMCNICQKLMSSSNLLELPPLLTIIGDVQYMSETDEQQLSTRLRLFCYHLLLPLQVVCSICQKQMSSSNQLD